MAAATGTPRKPPLLELRRVGKRYPGVVALDGVDFSLHAGEVHSVLGENGAGKSTLLALLAGLAKPDAGEVLLDGAPVDLDSPAAARARGIGAVRQHAALIPSLTVAENLLLGGGGALARPDRAVAAARFSALCQDFGLAIDPARLAGGLSLGEQQLADILRALWHGSRVLALDEPTAMLSPDGARHLLAMLRRLRDAGTAVLFITHKLDEALDVADRITVLRRGRVAGRFFTGQETPDHLREKLLAAMFGGAEAPLADTDAAAPAPAPAHRGTGSDILRVHGLTLAPRVENISFAIAPGEILGIAGIDGNGQTELAELLAGQRAADAGTVTLGGTDLAGFGVAARHRLGLRYVTDDRLGEGTVPAFPVALNLLLKRIGDAPFWRHGLARPREMAAHARAMIDAYDIRAAGPWAPAATLSGGNLQKLLLARELEGAPRLVIYNKPMHGLDTMTQTAIRQRIAAQAASGVGCLLISPDLDDILLLSHRIGVMRAGRLLGPLENGPGARQAVAALMAGGE